MEVDEVEPDNDEDAIRADSDDDEEDEGVKSKHAREEEEVEKKALEERQARFRKLWMGKVVTAFGNDLEQLRKDEPGLTGSKLELLIESLAAGTEVFSDGRNKKDDGSMEVDEIGVVLGD